MEEESWFLGNNTEHNESIEPLSFSLFPFSSWLSLTHLGTYICAHASAKKTLYEASENCMLHRIKSKIYCHVNPKPGKDIIYLYLTEGNVTPQPTFTCRSHPTQHHVLWLSRSITEVGVRNLFVSFYLCVCVSDITQVFCVCLSSLKCFISSAAVGHCDTLTNFTVGEHLARFSCCTEWF